MGFDTSQSPPDVPATADDFPTDRNPVLNAAGTHIAVARFALHQGALMQLYWPCDGVSAPTWVAVPELVVQ